MPPLPPPTTIKRTGRPRVPATVPAALAAAAAPPAWAEYALNLPAPASSIAQQIYDLHTLVLWICAVIFVIVFVPMGIALIRHRKSLGHPPHGFHDNFRLEVAWTVLPVLILIGMAWPATQTVLAMKDTSAPELTVKVTGSQWKWEYEYLGDNIRFTSSLATTQDEIANRQAKDPHYLLAVDRPLVVPTGQKVRLVFVASDVIHAWWVPALGVKQDAVPGFIRDAWFRVDKPGTYRGQCAELCGIGHGFMPVVVEAVPAERFALWKTEQQALAAAAQAASSKDYPLAELMAHGEKVYLANCAACHQANGAGLPGTFPPLAGSPVARGPVEAHIDRVLFGQPGTAMAAFGAQLSDFDLAAVVSYERNSWQNAAAAGAQPVQPKQVAARRR